MALTPQDRQELLKLARETIASQACGQGTYDVDLDAVSEDLQRDVACFVTLTKYGQLRGCIGSLEARQPLALDLR